MKAKNVLALVKKDLRMSRRVVAVSLFIWALPMLLGAIAAMVVDVPDIEGRSHVIDIMLWGGSWSFFLAYLLTPAIVGHLLAAEGIDRSAAFLAYMPFSRIESLAGKAISATMMTILFIGLNLLLVAIVFVLKLSGIPSPPTLGFLPVFLSAMVSIFGATWATAICLHSAAIAMVVGLAVPFLLYVYQMAYCEGVVQRTFVEGVVQGIFVPWSLGLGVAFFVVGVVVFMKRRPEA